MKFSKTKGFSYVEMILVIAVMAIMVAFTSLSYSMITRNNVTKAITKLDSAFSHAKTLSMAKGSLDGRLVLVCEGGHYYYYYGKEDTNKKLFAYSTCDVLLADESGAEIPLNTLSSVTFCYKPSSGAFSYVDPESGAALAKYSKVIIRNSTRESSLLLYSRTGKTEIKN